MRQGQQNRRGRGRSRKTHHNPLTRSYESAGPDVKIRGTPSHIAEKYMSLARDALSSGDPVLAENYLQHAEHYNRIIMTVREQNVQQSGDAMNGAGRHRSDGADAEAVSDEDGDEGESYAVPHRGQASQSRTDASRRGGDRPQRQDQARSSRDRDQEARSESSGERAAQQDQPAEQQAIETPPKPRAEAPQRRRERFGSAGQEQPEFLKRPVRRPRRDTNGGAAGEANGVAAKDEAGE